MWHVGFLVMVTIFKVLNYDIPFVYVAVVHSVVTILSLIPISFLGFGLKDVSAAYFYYLVGVPSAIAVNMVLLTALFKYFMSGLYYLANYKLISKELKGKSEDT